jgi:hypothetical protein
MMQFGTSENGFHSGRSMRVFGIPADGAAA